MFGKLGQHVVGQRADHNGIDVTRQHPSRVGDGFAAAELHLRAREHDRAAPQLLHADIEGNASPRRGAFENQGQHAPLKRRIRVLRPSRKADAGVLAPACRRDDAFESRGIEIGKVQEMPRACGCWLALSHGARGGHTAFLSVSKLAHAVTSAAMASFTWRSSMLSGGKRRTTFSVAPTPRNRLSRSRAMKAAAGT